MKTVFDTPKGEKNHEGYGTFKLHHLIQGLFCVFLPKNGSRQFWAKTEPEKVCELTWNYHLAKVVHIPFSNVIML